MSENRNKIQIKKFNTRDEFESKVDEIAKLQLKRSKLIAARDLKTQKVLEEYNPQILEIEENIALLQTDALPYASTNKDMLFGKRASASCSLANYGFRKATKKVVNISGKKDDIVAKELIDEGFLECAKIDYKLDKKGILRAIKDEVDFIKNRFKASQDVSFFVEAKTDKEIDK